VNGEFFQFVIRNSRIRISRIRNSVSFGYGFRRTNHFESNYSAQFRYNACK